MALGDGSGKWSVEALISKGLLWSNLKPGDVHQLDIVAQKMGQTSELSIRRDGTGSGDHWWACMNDFTGSVWSFTIIHSITLATCYGLVDTGK